MWLAFWLCISILPGLYTGWRCAGEWAWYLTTKEGYYHYHHAKRSEELGIEVPTALAWWYGYLVGIAAFFAWPLLVTALVFNRTKVITRAGFTPKKFQKRIYETRIRELEREVGIS